MVKTPCFQYRGPGFDVWPGNQIPHVAKTGCSQINRFFFFKLKIWSRPIFSQLAKFKEEADWQFCIMGQDFSYVGSLKWEPKSGLGLGQLCGRLGGGSSQEAEARGWEEEKDNTRTHYQSISPCSTWDSILLGTSGGQSPRWPPGILASLESHLCAVSFHIASELVCVTNSIQQKRYYVIFEIRS